MKFTIKSYIESHKKLADKLDHTEIREAINVIEKAFKEEKKIITFGNGGSASTASHYITDWNKMVNLATNNKFRGICLCDNVGLITAYANDISYDHVFSGQLESLADEGDLVIAVSGSGNSRNILKALETSSQIGCTSLGILGYDGGAAKDKCDYSFIVPSFAMQFCEDVHLQFGHLVMKHLCQSDIVS